MARAGSSEATSTVSSARGTVEIGFIAARTRSSPPTDIPPSVPPARPVRRRMTPSGPRSISSWATEPRRAAVRKPSPTSTPLIAWMPISAPGELRVEPAVPVHVRAQARRQAGDDHLDHPAEGVAVLVRGLDLGDHRGRPLGVEGAHRVGVERVDVVGGRQRRVRRRPTAQPIATVCDTSRMP